MLSATVAGKSARPRTLTQGDIEKRSGVVRPYLSRIENGHTVPSIETLEKPALEVPLYQLLYEGEKPPKLTHLPSAYREMRPLGAVRAKMHGF